MEVGIQIYKITKKTNHLIKINIKKFAKMNKSGDPDKNN